MDGSTISISRPARIRVMLVPVGKIRRSTFARYTSLLSDNCSSVSLAEIAPDTKGVTTMFSSQLSADGHLHFDFLTAYDKEHRYLEEFQPHRQVLGVIGLMSCQESDGLAQGVEQFETLRHKYSSALGHRCFAFEPREDQADNVKGVIVIPHVGQLSAYLNTLICDFASTLLSSLGSLAAIIENKSMIHSPIHPNGVVVTYGENNENLPQTGSASHSLVATATGRDRPNSPAVHSIRPPESPLPAAAPIPLLPKAASALTSPLLAAGSAVNAAGQALVVNTAIAMKAGVDAISSDMRTRKRSPGRVQKLIGDLYLMAGRLKEASSVYQNAIQEAKTNGDALWWSSAVEGLYCTVILSAIDGVHRTEETGGEPPSPDAIRSLFDDTSAQYKEVIYNYEKMGFQLLASEASLKIARLNAIGWKMGYTVEALMSLLHDASLDSEGEPKCSIPRLHVAQWSVRAWGPAVESMSTSEQISIATNVASVLGSVRLFRKQAFYLRLAALTILPLLVQVHLQASNQQKPYSAALETENRAGVLDILKRICGVYGLADDADVLDAKKEGSPMTEGDAFGWPDLQIAVLREAATVCEALPDHESMMKYTTLLLRKLHHHLPREEQLRLSASLQRVVAQWKAVAGGHGTALNGIWGAPLSMTIEPCRPPPRMAPFAERRPILSKQAQKATADPFLYNPFGQKTSVATDVILVAKEVATFQLTLWNIFAFDLELDDITLSTTGVDFKSSPTAAIVPAGSLMTVQVTGIPQTSGDLTVKGCTAKIFGCIENFETFKEVPGQSKRRDKDVGPLRDVQAPFRYVKRSGLSALDPVKSRMSAPKSTVKEFLKLKVIEEMPLVKVNSTSLLHGAMMLFEGEESVINVQLENVSNVPVDHVAVTFVSTSPAPDPTESRTLTPEETYESDLYASKPVICPWEAEEPADPRAPAGYRWLDLPPGARHNLTLSVFGKRTCVGGTLQIQYCHFGTAEQTSDSSTVGNDAGAGAAETEFYSRQIALPILLTVHQGLKALNTDILLFQSHEQRQQGFHSSQVDDEDDPEMPVVEADTWLTRKVVSAESLDSQRKGDQPRQRTSSSGPGRVRKTSVSIEHLLQVGGGSLSSDKRKLREKAASLAQAVVDGNKEGAVSSSRTEVPSLEASPNYYCLFTVDIHNTWTVPFEAVFMVNDSKNPAEIDPSDLIVSTAVIQPGRTKRIVLPVRRINISDDESTKPIPTISPKQFVVSKGPKPTKEQEANNRRLFWYKEHLLRRVAATWQCSGNRAGVFDLRGLRLSLPMLKVLNTEQISFSFNIVDPRASSVDQQIRPGNFIFECAATDFVCINMILTNRQERPVKLCIRFLPTQDYNNGQIDTELSDRLIWQGTSQRLLPLLEPGASVEVKCPVCFISHGRYKLLYHAQDVETGVFHYGTEPLVVDVYLGR